MKKAVLLTILLLCHLLSAHVSFGENVIVAGSSSSSAIEPLSAILRCIDENYPDPVDTSTLIQAAVDGMFVSLDPHSAYLSREQTAALSRQAAGRFCGIGVEVEKADNGLMVLDAIEGGTAYEQGIVAGELIVAVDLEAIGECSLQDAVLKLRGEAGSSVSVTVRNPGSEKLRTLLLKRRPLKSRGLSCRVVGSSIVLIRIMDFQKSVTRQIRNYLRDTKKKLELGGVILDLRNNPGGLLMNAVNVADIFLKDGIIVTTRGRRADQNRTYTAHSGGSNYQFPLLVLVNGNTASSAEVLAGALQDNRRAVVLGTRTFGKGTIQLVFPLSDGSAIRLTTGRYFTPSGHSIQALGINPDIILPVSKPLHEKCPEKSIREEGLPGHLPNQETVADRRSAGSGAGEREKQKRTEIKGDIQLQVAISVLKSMALLTVDK